MKAINILKKIGEMATAAFTAVPYMMGIMFSALGLMLWIVGFQANVAQNILLPGSLVAFMVAFSCAVANQTFFWQTEQYPDCLDIKPTPRPDVIDLYPHLEMVLVVLSIIGVAACALGLGLARYDALERGFVVAGLGVSSLLVAHRFQPKRATATG